MSSVEQQAGDPTTDPAVLAALAHQHPELRSTIAANPAAYEGLRQWITDNAVNTETALAATAAAAEAGTAAATARPAWRSGRVVGLAAAALALVLIVGGGISYAATQGTRAESDPAATTTSDTSGTDDGAESDSASSDDAGVDPTDSSDGSSDLSSTPVSQAVEGTPTVVILDASGSMIRNAPTGGTRMDGARAAALAFVDGLGTKANVGLTVFGTSTGSDDADKAAGCRDVKTIVPVGPADKGALSTAINGIVQSGYTPIGLSLRSAVDQLPADAPGNIVVVSDGVDTCAPPPSCDVATELRTSHPQITIHTVGFLVDADEEAQEQLECIAQVGGGEYVMAQNADQLAARLKIAADPASVAGSITSTGMNSLRIGMSYDQARLSEPSVEKAKITVEIVYVDCDFARLQFTNGLLTAIEPHDATATAEGLAIGDKLGLGTQLYNAALSSASDADGNYTIFDATPGSRTGYKMYYEPSTNLVVRIVSCLCGSNAAAVDTDMANWVIDFTGVGPIKMGSTFSDAYGYLPLQNTSCEAAVTVAKTRRSPGLNLVTDWDDPTQKITNIYVDSYIPDTKARAATSALPRTSKGIGIGSTIDELIAAHPGVSLVQWTKGNDYYVLTGRNGVSIMFSSYQNDGVVDSISVDATSIPVFETCG